MRTQFIDNITNLAKHDKNVIFITGDLGYGVIEKFSDSYPKQFLNSGVAEQTMIGIAAGLATENKKVFVYSIANFPTLRCLEQIRNDLCYHNLPVTIVSVGAGLSYSKLGYTHHAIEDISIMRSLPKLTIYSPATSLELEVSMQEIYSANVPNYLRLGQICKWSSPEFPVEISGSITFQSTGTDALILTTSSMLDECQLLGENLRKEGRHVTVASAFKLKPFFIVPEFVSKFTLIVTIEEHSINGGLGSILNDYIIKNNLKTTVINIGLGEDIASTFGDLNYLREIYGIDALSLIRKLKDKI